MASTSHSSGSAAPRGRRREALWLAAGLVLLAFALRLYRLPNQNIWWDEGWTIWLAQQSLAGIALRTAVDAHPPLHYWLMHFWIDWAGPSALAGRLLSAFFGLGMVALMYRVGRTAGGPRLGLLAALLLALARFHIWWSQDIKNYTLAGAFGLAAVWFTLRLFQPGPAPRRRLWLAYVAATLLAVYSHYLAWLLFLANNVFALVCLVTLWLRAPALAASGGGPSAVSAAAHSLAHTQVSLHGARSRFWGWVLAQLGVLALFAPWLALHLNRATTWEAAPPVALGFFVRLAATLFTLGATLNIEQRTLAVILLLLPALLGAAWALAGRPLGRGLVTRQGQTALLSLLLITLPPLTLWVLSLTPAAFFAPQLTPRYLLMFLPGYTLLAALGLLAVARRWRAAGLSAIIVVLALQSGSLSEYYSQRRLRDEYFTLANVINNFALPGDVVVMHTDQEWPVMIYHLRQPLPWDGVLAGEPLTSGGASAFAQRLAADYDRVWLVTIPDALAKDPNHLMAAELAARLPIQFDQAFTDKRLTLFAPGPEPAQAVPPANFAPQYPRRAALGAGLTLLGFDLPMDEANPGETVSLVTYWDAAAPAQVTITVEDEAGAIADTETEPVPTGDIVRLQTELRLPPSAEGEQTVVVAAEQAEAALAEIEAQPVAIPDPGPIASPVRYVFGGMVALAGYHLPETATTPGAELAVDLFWTSVAPVDQNYKVFVQLVGVEFNPATGNPLWGQVDRQPWDGALPMTLWPPDEVIRDPYLIPVDPAAPPGEYTLVVGLYDGVTGQRLQVSSPDGLANDHVVLGVIQMEN